MTAFYRELIQISKTTEDATHSVLAIAGFELVIHKLSYEQM